MSNKVYIVGGQSRHKTELFHVCPFQSSNKCIFEPKIVECSFNITKIVPDNCPLFDSKIDI